MISRRRILALLGMSGVVGYFCRGLIRPGHRRTNSVTVDPALYNSGSRNDYKPGPNDGTDVMFRFVAVGDTGSGSQNQYAAAQAMSRYYESNPFKLAILAGDNIYTNGEIEKIGVAFEQPYRELIERGVEFRAVLGNHDVRTQNGEPQVRYSGFNMLRRYYSFSHGPVQFFGLDTNAKLGRSAQLAWLERELSASRAAVKIVVGHHPVYSSGHYGSSVDLIDTLTPLFKKYAVRLYLNGHEHNYERTCAIAGTTYVVCGAGGAEFRTVERSDWTAASASRYCFVAYEVFGSAAEHKAVYIRLNAIGNDENSFDSSCIKIG